MADAAKIAHHRKRACDLHMQRMIRARAHRAGSGEQLQRECRRQRIEMTTIGGGDATDAERFADGDHRRIDETEIELVVATVQLGDSRVRIARQIDDQVMTFGQARVEGEAAFRAEAMAEQMIDCGDHGRGQDEAALLALDDGTRARTFGAFTWTPSPRFRTGVNFNIQDIELPAGDFTTRIISTTFDVVFSSRLSWTNLIQYDNVSEVVGLNLRLNWIPEAGRELFFVINHNMQDFDRDNRFHSVTSDVVAKASYTFRF